MIAADANRSGTVTTYDLVELRKLILGIYKDLPQNTSWRFVSKKYAFPDTPKSLEQAFPESLLVPNSSENMLDADFIAVKIGDLDFSANANVLHSATPRNNAPSLSLQVIDQTFEAGEKVNLTLQATEQQHIQGYQFALKFDETTLSYQGFENAAINNLEEANFGINRVAEGFITTSWDRVEGLSIIPAETLFELQFIAKQAGTLSQVIDLDTRMLSAEIYTKEQTVQPLQFDFIKERGKEESLRVFQNKPNPFSTQTTIGFEVSKAESVTISIYDARGRTVQVINDDYTKGYHEITLTKAKLPTSGLLYYIVETAEQRIGKRMLVIE